MALLFEAWRYWIAIGAALLGAAAAISLWAIPRGRGAQRRSQPSYRRPLESLYPHRTPITDPAQTCAVCAREIGPWYMWRRIHRGRVEHLHPACADANGDPLPEPSPPPVSVRQPRA